MTGGVFSKVTTLYRFIGDDGKPDGVSTHLALEVPTCVAILINQRPASACPRLTPPRSWSKTDLYLSTLRRFVEAAGGTLELRVELPGTGVIHLTGMGELNNA